MRRYGNDEFLRQNSLAVLSIRESLIELTNLFSTSAAHQNDEKPSLFNFKTDEFVAESTQPRRKGLVKLLKVSIFVQSI